MTSIKEYNKNPHSFNEIILLRKKIFYKGQNEKHMGNNEKYFLYVAFI